MVVVVVVETSMAPWPSLDDVADVVNIEVVGGRGGRRDDDDEGGDAIVLSLRCYGTVLVLIMEYGILTFVSRLHTCLLFSTSRR